MSESKPSFKRELDGETDVDFFDWHPRMSAENLALLDDELSGRELKGVLPREVLAGRWPALERVIEETQEQCAGRVLRPLFLPYDSLELPRHFDGLHVWLISVPDASPEQLLKLSKRTNYDGGYAHWPTLWELTSRGVFGTDTLRLDVYDLEHGRLQDASECGAVLVVYASHANAALTPMLSGIFDLTSDLLNYKPFRRFELAELQRSTHREQEEVQSPDVLAVWARPIDSSTIGYESHRRTLREVRVGGIDSVTTLQQPAFSGRSELFVLLAGPAKDLALLQDRLPSAHWMVFLDKERPLAAVLCMEDTKPSALIATLAFAVEDTLDPARLKRLLSDTKLAYEDFRTGRVTELAFPGSLRVETCHCEPADDADTVDLSKLDRSARSHYIDEWVQRHIRERYGLKVKSFAHGDWTVED